MLEKLIKFVSKLNIMKILSIILILLLVTFNANSQKKDIKVKDDIVTVDGTAVFKMTSVELGNLTTIYNLQGERLIVFTYQTYNDEAKKSQANPSGAVRYLDVTFLNEAMDKCEIRVETKKGIAKQVIDNELIDENGKLNDKMIQQFVRIHGTKFSDNKKTSTTIIINN